MYVFAMRRRSRVAQIKARGLDPLFMVQVLNLIGRTFEHSVRFDLARRVAVQFKEGELQVPRFPGRFGASAYRSLD